MDNFWKEVDDLVDRLRKRQRQQRKLDEEMTGVTGVPRNRKTDHTALRFIQSLKESLGLGEDD